MFSFIKSIFVSITYVGAILLSNVGIVSVPVKPVPVIQVPKPAVVESTKKIEDPKKVEISKNKPAVEITNKPATEIVPKPVIKTFMTPSGAVVDEYGNVIKAPIPVQQPTQVSVSALTSSDALKIISLDIAPAVPSTLIEWQTSQPTTSKIFISVPAALPVITNSVSGLSTRHAASIPTLPGRIYSIEIEAITNDGKVVKIVKQFQTPSAAAFTLESDRNATIIGYGYETIEFHAHLTNHQGEYGANEVGSFTIGSQTTQFLFDTGGNFTKSITPEQTGDYIVRVSVPSYGFEKTLNYTVIAKKPEIIQHIDGHGTASNESNLYQVNADGWFSINYYPNTALTLYGCVIRVEGAYIFGNSIIRPTNSGPACDDGINVEIDSSGKSKTRFRLLVSDIRPDTPQYASRYLRNASLVRIYLDQMLLTDPKTNLTFNINKASNITYYSGPLKYELDVVFY